MKCKIKVNDLFISDIYINNNDSVPLIEFQKELFYVFSSGEEAEDIKSILVRELAIPKESISIFAV